MPTSTDFNWYPRRPGNPETYTCRTSAVNVDFLKYVLAHEAFPIFPHDISQIELDETRSVLVIAPGAERGIRKDDIRNADVTLPVIVSFLPDEVEPDGSIYWRTDIVDGHHRVAAAKKRSMTEMAFVMIPPDIAAMATAPQPEFMGRVSSRSDFSDFRQVSMSPTILEELTKLIGSQFGQGWSG